MPSGSVKKATDVTHTTAGENSHLIAPPLCLAQEEVRCRKVMDLVMYRLVREDD
jgi:hypothetical protein